ncbi:MAG: site-2 protease family protein [Patescibacteria group bacterium]|nr:site-2 protease family protein [Patescibacteria group bacterium]
MSLTLALLSVAALLVSLTVHEYCHALVAYFLGDETARRYGRLTLNPAAHIDPIGTILIPLFGILTGLPVIGWAKPVPVNPYNLRHGKWGGVIVSLAGPASNFTIAILSLLLLRVAMSVVGLGETNLLVLFLYALATISISLGVFNLLPVPPLDGSALLERLFDHPRYRPMLVFLETRGPFLLLMLVFLDSFLPFSILGWLFNGVAGFIFRLVGF